ncbi:MAG: hypothetical protein U0Q16_32510 [Bryobacteraceae bacterium]
MIIIGAHLFVEKYAAAQLAWSFLERQRDEIPETALGHGVLIREEPIIGIKAELVTALHRLGEQQRSQGARETSGNGPLEENPNVCPVSGTRAFNRRGYAEGGARVAKSSRIVFPCFLVEVHGEEPAGFIEQQRIHADRVLAGEMIVDRFVVKGHIRLGLLVNALSILRFGGIVGLPVALSVWRVASAAVGAFPSPGVDVLASTKEGSKEGNLFWSFELRDWGRRFGWGQRGGRDGDAVLV